MRVQDRNMICRAAHCRTEQDSGGKCMRVQDRTGYAEQPIAGQNKTVLENGKCTIVQDRTGHAGQLIAGQNKTVEDSA